MQHTQTRVVLVSVLVAGMLVLASMLFSLHPAHVARLGTPSAYPPYAALAAETSNSTVSTLSLDAAKAGSALQGGATVAVCSGPMPIRDDGSLAYSVYLFVPSDFVTMYGGGTDWQGPVFYSKAFIAQNPGAASTYSANSLPAGAYFIWTAQTATFSCATGIVPVGGGSTACLPQECGPLQHFPSVQCLNKTAPTFLCERGTDGKCGYVPVCSGGGDTSSAVSTDLASCLPSGHTIDELDSRVYPAGQTVPTTYGIAVSGNQYGIHLGDFLSNMGAHCTDGVLRDSAGNPVLFSSTVPCAGGAMTADGFAQFQAEAARWNQEVAGLLPHGTVVISGYCVPLP